MISDTLAIGIHHLLADAENPFCQAVVAELRRLYALTGERPPSLLECYYYTPPGLIEPAFGSGAMLKNTIDSIVGNPPYVQTDSYAVLRETCPTLDADDAPDPEEDV